MCLFIVGAVLIGITKVQGDTPCFYVDDICPNGNISFWLRTRETDYEGIEITEENLDDVPLIEGAPLIVSIHGWTGHKNYSPNPELISAYLKHGDYNIVSVDWGMIALPNCYISSAFNVPVAGRCSAQLLQQLYTKRGKHWKEKTHVIGFSLGAHVAGVLGYYLPGLPRITGLDPALPLFTSNTARPESRLDSSDANFVDVYHTNGGWQGRLGPLGHCDFYLNNGANQLGCNFNASCNHHRAVVMFAESINSDVGFYGQPCMPYILSFLTGIISEICPYSRQGNVLVRAGEYVNPKVRGSYKIETNSVSPLAKGLPLSEYTNQMAEYKFYDDIMKW